MKIVLLLLVINLIVIAALYWRLIRRYSEIVKLDNSEKNDRTYQKMIQLITEFNRASNTNIDILENKIEELRKEIEKASIKINQLKGISKKRKKKITFSEVNKEGETKKKEDLEEVDNDRYELANSLINQGLATDEVAKRVKLSKSEVELLSQLRKKIE